MVCECEGLAKDKTLAMKKKRVSGLYFPSYVRIIVNHCKDPNETTTTWSEACATWWMVESEEEVQKELGRPPLLNKLGLITKVKEDGSKKHRLIWDLRESKANLACSQGERIILPKLMDVAEAAVTVYKSGKQPWIAVADIQDAFLNIPSGSDKFATTTSSLQLRLWRWKTARRR